MTFSPRENYLKLIRVFPNFFPCVYIKVGCKGVFVTQTCFRDVKVIVTIKGSNSLSPVTRKPAFGVFSQVQHNQAVQLQMMARGIKFLI